ncbi:cutinase family protein [Williamsia deligens]|uniref:Cutinase n=1 Tax=Williamsia deligens TaxID=321325 RepID=A0ABW3GAC0_9NOCA|nr:cutinase family protein [Williamsia deligens]MCP2195150.1 cutinase [Williamsia deligens]
MIKRLLASASVLAAVAASVSGIAVTAPAAAATCSNVEVIFARGTAEPAPPIGLTGSSFVAAVRSQLPGRSVAAYGVNYPASASFTDRIGTARSVITGVNDVQRRIAYLATACPGTRVVLGGYSQGAVVAGYTVSPSVVLPPEYRTFTPRALAPNLISKIAAVVLFAPPSARFLSDAGAPAVRVRPELTNRTARYCIPSDNICNGARLAGPGAVHVLYGVNGDTLRAASYVAGALRR